ncbi:MAG: SGNH/GDSL hydrolase family protein [Nitrospira sp.]|nr:SGNH/GDSL hydrolase family protein [Nitrospira sp.]
MKDKATGLTLGIFLCGCVVLWLTGVTSTKHLVDNLVTGYLLSWGLYALLSDLPRKEIQGRFVLMTLCGIVVLGMAELLGVAGLVNYQVLFGTHGREWFDRSGYVRDPELGYRREAHYQERGSFVRGNIGEALCLPAHPPASFDLRYDHRGFRNDTDMDRADVVVIGDSYVESPMLPGASLLTTQLSHRLRTSVANLGISGYGPEQELVVLKRYALALQPKTIVWVFFEGNDLYQLAPEDQEVSDASDITAAHDEYWMRSLTRNLLLLSRKAAQGCVPHPDYLRLRGRFQDTEGKETLLYFWEKLGALKATDRLRLERLRSILAEASQVSRQQGIRLVVAFAPVKHRVHQGLDNFEPLTEEMREWPLNDLPAEVASMLKGLVPEAEFLDLTPPLREAAAQGVLTYLPDDTHWTAEGQRVAGEAIHHLLAGSPTRLAQQ